ncbi:MAG: M20/M25/M40 family metallo-hydrolase [Gemmatimonadaceae bacterium]
MAAPDVGRDVTNGDGATRVSAVGETLAQRAGQTRSAGAVFCVPIAERYIHYTLELLVRTVIGRVLALGMLVAAAPVAAQERVDTLAIAKIKDEGFQRSQVMETASWLTDVYGARLTGSPGTRTAGEWAAKTLTDWGLVGAHLEPWGPFGRGWSNDYLSVQVTAPTPYPVIAYAAAWTPGTNGPVSGNVIRILVDSAKDFEKYRGQLKGKFVMTMPGARLAHFAPDGRRLSEDDLDRMAAAQPPAQQGGNPMAFMQSEGFRRAQELAAARAAFFAQEGVAAVLVPGRGDMGTVFTGSTGSRDPKTPTLTPTIIVAAEHYNRILRTLEKNVPVTLEVNAKNTFYDTDLNSFNVIAEIPGTDPALKSEVVMLGAHFDSWHAGTGATDNAAGSAVMMEAVRILKAAGLPLRRTVRIALWTGEEQGLLGSRAYVKDHFADLAAKTVKPEHETFAGYFNVDNGTGKIRGVYLQGNQAVAPIFKAWMKPFEPLGMHTITPSNTGGTDHLAFDAVGLPGWQFIQDDVEYVSRTHHSNMDVWDRLVADDMKHNAVVVAAFVYLAANRDQKLPRKAMPAM